MAHESLIVPTDQNRAEIGGHLQSGVWYCIAAIANIVYCRYWHIVVEMGNI
jgi:hypothetical protein